MPIRRFDIFAEYNRLHGLKHGLDEAHAKGYGLWVAKVVASGGGRRIGAKAAVSATQAEREGAEAQQKPAEQEWHVLGGVPQTGALFDREIVRRMGPEFYAQVFVPAVDAAFAAGKSYESIRDAIRRDWKPLHAAQYSNRGRFVTQLSGEKA
jgi:hypothetical protein